jgi:uncharacterized protein (UPF0332 family)
MKEILEKENALNKILNAEVDETKDDELSNDTEKDVDSAEEISSNDALNLKSEISDLKKNVQVILDETKEYKVPSVINEKEVFVNFVKKSMNDYLFSLFPRVVFENAEFAKYTQIADFSPMCLGTFV